MRVLPWLHGFPVCQWNSICDILSHDVRPFLLPAGALLCLGFNGCHSAYHSQHSCAAGGVGPGGVGDGRRLAPRDGEGISPWAHPAPRRLGQEAASSHSWLGVNT